MYPEFTVLGVKPEDTWQLFNVSNFAYYCQKVTDLKNGVCPFCTIDPSVNTVLHENNSWRLWENKMAPRSGKSASSSCPPSATSSESRVSRQKSGQIFSS